MNRTGVLAEARESPGQRWQVAIDPRLAARRRAVRRRHTRGRRVLVAAVVVVSLLAAATWPLLHSRLFSARVLSVVGAHHTPVGAVLAAAGLAGHPPLLDVDAGAAAARVARLAWVRSARVELHWPDAVVVVVHERVPVAELALGRRWAEVDRTGRVLAVVDAAPGLVRLVGVRSSGRPGSTVARARGALTVAGALPSALRPLVDAVGEGAGGVDLALGDGVGVLMGSPTQLPAKFEDVASVVAGASPPPGSILDVSVPAFPTLTPPRTG